MTEEFEARLENKAFEMMERLESVAPEITDAAIRSVSWDAWQGSVVGALIFSGLVFCVGSLFVAIHNDNRVTFATLYPKESGASSHSRYFFVWKLSAAVAGAGFAIFLAAHLGHFVDPTAVLVGDILRGLR